MGPLLSLVGRPSTRVVLLKPNKDSAYINRLFEEGRLKPVIDGPYPLEELPAQMRRFGEGTHRGKIVIAMA
jgi:NADPH:quinone reductase-like Zn-dependent oxidoreductase